jgi:hypothetical protein
LHFNPSLRNNLILNFYSYLYDELKDVSVLLKYYLKRLEATTVKPRYDFSKVSPDKIDTVLTFNYTDTFSKNYYKPIDIDFVNGKLDENNIILGIENPNKDEFNHYCDNGLYKFFKYYQRINNNAFVKHSKWLEAPQVYTWAYNEKNGTPSEDKWKGTFMIATAKKNINIFIIGHSLDICDKQILEKVILAAKNVTVFYYSKKDREDKIVKLSKLLGEKQIIESVNDPTGSPYIIFKDLKEIEIN